MNNCHSIGTPLATKPKLDVDLSGEPVDQSDYRSKIGSLVYLTSSRPDLVQADSGFELTAFSDADHARCIDTRKSTSGGIQFLGDKLVRIYQKLQENRQKTDKHRHEKRKSTREPKIQNQSQRKSTLVNYASTEVNSLEDKS
ncbi:retrovirus-related pol polyprotein from transposon TNT 1-94 [Tanacetum coccineum]